MADDGLTAVQANQIFDILEAELHVAPALRDEFVYHQTQCHMPEIRVQGVLGFGGKLYRDAAGSCRVSCYPEDETPENRALIERVNKMLKEVAHE